MSIIECERDLFEETEREIRELPETPEPKTREQILLDAADLIERVGYAHGSAGLRHGGNVCILGAVAQAASMRLYDYDGRDPMYRMDNPARLLRTTPESAYEWNDRLWLESYSKRTHKFFGRKISPATRVATCLRAVASGVSFDEAKLLS